MKKVLLGFAVIMAGLVIYSLLFQSLEDQPSVNKPALPSSQVDLAPDFTLTDLNGNNVSLSDYRGQNVYVNFWASWCGPCRVEMPDIEEIHGEYQDKDLIVLTVNIGENQTTVQRYIDSNGFTFPVLLDSDQKVARLYKVNSIPASIFIDKEGKVRSQRVGVLTKEQMVSYIENL